MSRVVYSNDYVKVDLEEQFRAAADGSIGIKESTADVGEMVFSNSDVSLYLRILKAGQHIKLTYLSEAGGSQLEFRTMQIMNGYRTMIIVNGQKMADRMFPHNILAPIDDGDTNESSRFTTAGLEIDGDIAASYTYRYWDGIKQVTGPSYLIKYHHPDRATYGIGTWQTVTLIGNNIDHNQMSEALSDVAASGGWTIIFATIGAAIGGTHGAFVGALLGVLFGYATSAILKDENGCIWWWWGQDYGEWLLSNIGWLSASGPLGMAQAATQFWLNGYLRVGSATLYDGIGAGNP
ncbi:MAG: hypothetical protein R6V83_05495 [Candidatus Thorarchaeota archaeon]